MRFVLFCLDSVCQSFSPEHVVWLFIQRSYGGAEVDEDEDAKALSKCQQ